MRWAGKQKKNHKWWKKLSLELCRAQNTTKVANTTCDEDVAACNIAEWKLNEGSACNRDCCTWCRCLYCLLISLYLNDKINEPFFLMHGKLESFGLNQRGTEQNIFLLLINFEMHSHDWPRGTEQNKNFYINSRD